MTHAGKRARPGPTEDLSFEAAVLRLEEIVQSIEEGSLSLEDSLALFEEGVRLLRRAEQVLSSVETRVQQLLPDGDGFRLEPFGEAPEDGG